MMKGISSQLDDKDNNFLCLICGYSAEESFDNPCKSDGDDSGISKQLSVIFILRNLLQVPNSQLEKFLKKYGNPVNWISLCAQCTQLTGKAKDLHFQIVEISRKLKEYQKLIVEKVKLSTDTLPGVDDENRRSKVNKARRHLPLPPQITLWKETRKFVKNYNYDDLYQHDPSLEANKLIKKLESQSHLQNQSSPTTLKNDQEISEEGAPPKIKLEPEDQDNHEDLSSGTPPSPSPPPPDPDNQEDPSSDWMPSSTEPEDPGVTTTTPAPISKPKRIRNRHPPLPPSEYTNQCLHCPLKFRFFSQAFAHMHSSHSVSDYPCLHPNCLVVSTTIKKYSKHRVKRHLKPKPPPPKKVKVPKIKVPPPPSEEPQPRVFCDICGGDFASKNNLQQHIKFVHEKSKVYKKFDVSCHICGLVVKNVNLRIHLLRLHKEEVEVPARKVKGEEGPRQPASLHKCPVVGCKIVYLRKEGLDKHMIRFHGGGGGDPGGDGAQVKFFRYSCIFCGKGFSVKRFLAHHEMVHRNAQLNVKPFKCDLCEKGFSTKKYLSYHKYHTHKLAKKFKMKQGQNN